MAQPGTCLLMRTRSLTCAVPLPHVVETLRPLPLEPLASPPPFVLGLSVIRGAPVPVVDLGRLLGAAGAPLPVRFVVLRVAGRRVALAVEGVLGVRELDPARLQDLPPLLSGAEAGAVEAVAAHDAHLLVVLRAARTVPDDLRPMPEAS